jgi:NADP-dependent aldehyde dehydrogenase
VVFLPADGGGVDGSGAADAFVTVLADAVAATTVGPMLDARIREHFTARRAELVALPGITDATPEAPVDGVHAGVLVTDLVTWEREPLVREECFGPLIVVVRCRADELIDTVATVPGGLTASLWSEPDDAIDRALAGELVVRATTRVGRVLHDGVPTGVSVSWAQQHGGPYPATSAAGTTSVGMHAMDRFLRPVTYQDLPPALLPACLHDANPWSLPRRVDGRLELP